MTNAPGSWTDEHTAALRLLWPAKVTQSKIAAELGFSPALISIKAQKLNLPARRAPNIRSQDAAYLAREAAKRDMSPRRLASLIIRTVTRDRLVGAVLDDGVTND